MDHLADRLDRSADALSTVERRLPSLVVAGSVFGAADASGLPGRLGHELHAHWTAVLGARSREAAGAAARVSGAARAVRETAEHYTGTDESVRRRIMREA